MTKLLVEINGNFSLLDYFGGKQNIKPGRPYVVNKSAFISERISKNQLSLKGTLKDSATDAALVKALNEAAKTSKKDASAEDIKSAGIKNFLKDYDINAKDETSNGSRNNGNQQ